MKQKLHLLICFAFLVSACSLNLNAQTLLTEKTYDFNDDDWGMAIDTTSDGGCIVVGGTYEIIWGYGNVLVVKFDANGDTLWHKVYGDGYWQRVYSVKQTADKGYIITGNSWDANSQTDVYIMKLKSDGSEQWTKTIGGPNWESSVSVKQTSDGGYVVAGRTESYGPSAAQGNPNIYLVRLDASGDTLWTKGIGDSGWDEGYEVWETPDKGFVIGGVGTNTSTGDKDALVVKTDKDGKVVWSKQYGGPNWDAAQHIQPLSGGGYVMAGFYGATEDGNGNPTNCDFYLLKLDANGDTLWTKTFGGANTDIAHVVREAIGGGFVMAGTTESVGKSGKNGYVIKADANGNSKWTQLVNNDADDVIHDMQVNRKGEYLLTGWSFNSNAEADLLFAKVKEDGLSGIRDHHENLSIAFFPNPSSGKLYLKAEELSGKFLTLKLINVIGNKVFEKNGSYEELSQNGIDITSLRQGMYFLTITTSDAGILNLKKPLVLVH